MNTQDVQLDITSSITHIFDETVHQTTITEYGFSWKTFTSGNIQPPLQGARFDIAFEGNITGENINGVIKGVDFLEVRADGKFMLNIQATIITSDGESIALNESGVLTPDPAGYAKLHLNMNFSTASPRYEWLNKKQVWGIGEVNMFTGIITVKGYSN
ncbi:MAG: DUF3237 family protein [Ignavibacteriaceae bacterium]